MTARRRAATLVVWAIVALAAGGCGQKGPLTMPASAASAASASTR